MPYFGYHNGICFYFCVNHGLLIHGSGRDILAVKELSILFIFFSEVFMDDCRNVMYSMTNPPLIISSCILTQNMYISCHWDVCCNDASGDCLLNILGIVHTISMCSMTLYQYRGKCVASLSCNICIFCNLRYPQWESGICVLFQYQVRYDKENNVEATSSDFFFVTMTSNMSADFQSPSHLHSLPIDILDSDVVVHYIAIVQHIHNIQQQNPL